MKKVNYLVLCLFMFAATAQETSVGKLPSLNWQKQSLIKNIKQKVRDSLKTVLKKDQFFVDVKVETKSISKPDFNKSDTENNSEDGNVSGVAVSGKTKSLLNKFENVDELNADGTPKKDNSAENKDKVKFEDKDPTEKDGDYIVFSKLGIVAPLVDDFNDFQPDGKIHLSMEGGSGAAKKKIKDLNTQITARDKEIDNIKKELSTKTALLKKGSKNGISAIEQMWKYNESLDIFNNIKKVTIKVSVSNEIGEDIRPVIENIVNSLSFNMGKKVKPVIEVAYLDFVRQGVKKDMTYYLDMLSKFSGIIATLIGVILFGGILLKVAKILENAMGGGGASNSAFSGSLKSESEDDKDDAGGYGAGAGLPDGGANSIGIERFESFLENSPSSAVGLVRKWIKSNGSEEVNALRAIVQQLENTKLMQIFQIVSLEDRESWKEYLDKVLSDAELTKTNSFISNSIVEEIIAPSAINDEEINDMMLQISPKRAADFIIKSPNLGAILLNVMNKSFIGQVMIFIPTEKTASIIDAGMKFRRTNITGSLEELKDGLRQFVDSSEKIPFIKRIEELLPEVMPDKEASLYTNLIKYGSTEVFVNIAKTFFPYDLIIALPKGFLRDRLRDYELGKKIEFLLSVSDSEREYFVNLFAPVGTKAFDLLEFEFEKAQNNIATHKRIKNESLNIQKEFLSYIRTEIRSDESTQSSVEEILLRWGSEIKNGKNAKEAVDSVYDSETVTDYNVDNSDEFDEDLEDDVA